MKRRAALLWPLLALGLAMTAAADPAEEAPEWVLLATTTSVRDSGLLDELLPVFEEGSGIHVRVVAVGTGAALRMGGHGDADLLLTHAPPGEEELLASGAALSRQPFMENHFVLVGPPEDPADVRGAGSPEEAYRRIARSGSPYVSRADDSGTHRREQALLLAAGLPEDASFAGMVRTGASMGITLQVAGERRAYALSDIGTFLAFEKRSELEVLSAPAPGLRNVYSLLPVSPQRFPGRIHARAAERLAAFFLAPQTQRRIAAYGQERYGRPLFRPLRADPDP